VAVRPEIIINCLVLVSVKFDGDGWLDKTGPEILIRIAKFQSTSVSFFCVKACRVIVVMEEDFLKSINLNGPFAGRRPSETGEAGGGKVPLSKETERIPG
jgi:hypothetical protein